MSSTLTSAHLISISPYHPSLTSPLLFGSYSALHELYLTILSPSHAPPPSHPTHPPNPPTTTSLEDDLSDLLTISSSDLPALLVIESRSHPAAARNAPAWPAYPQDVINVGSGKDVEEFKKVWEGEVREAAREEKEEGEEQTM